MLRALDGEPVDGVVVDHVGDGLEGPAELAEDVVPRRRLLDPHVHVTVAALETKAVILPGTLAVPDEVGPGGVKPQGSLSLKPRDIAMVPFLLMKLDSRVNQTKLLGVTSTECALFLLLGHLECLVRFMVCGQRERGPHPAPVDPLTSL